MNSDLVKLAVIGAIMGALLLFGLLLQPIDKAAEPVVAAPVQQTAVKEVTIVYTESLELLDPVYSEKAVFQDDTIRVSFDASLVENGVESRIPFWFYNVSDDVISILWDRCSIQLPLGNTVWVVSEQSLKYDMGPTISVAPAGDLFDAIVPISEIQWSEDGYSVTTGVLDQGTFTLVLAIERAVVCPHMVPCPAMQQIPAGCEAKMPMPMANCNCSAREIVYYTFRFVVR